MKLFVMNSSRAFGERVAAALNIVPALHEETEFEDGEHKTRPVESVRNEDVYVIGSLYSDQRLSVNDKLCRLLFFINALKDASAGRITAVVPYLCYARQDRKIEPRDPITARYVAQLFETAGIDRIMTMDIHNLQAFQNAFRCPAEHLQARRLFADYLMTSLAAEDLVIMSPDIGSIRRAQHLQQLMGQLSSRDIPLVFMEKIRSRDRVRGDRIAGDVRERTVVIIDDIISTGGTLARAAMACRQAGARDILAMVTHGLFAGRQDKKLQDEYLRQIIVTNTVPAYRLEQHRIKEKLTVLDATPLFAEAIRRLNKGGSVTEIME